MPLINGVKKCEKKKKLENVVTRRFLLFSVIEEANWLTLSDDIENILDGGFDAVICLGNSFAHLMDTTGDQYDQKQALRHFERCVKPGGLLLIDHRNFDHIVDTGSAPARCIYYNVWIQSVDFLKKFYWFTIFFQSPHTTDIATSVLYVRGKPAIVTMDYSIDLSTDNEKEDRDENQLYKPARIEDWNTGKSEFRLSYYPHRLEHFKDMLDEIFPLETKHTIYGDFRPLDEIEAPGFYIHVLEKPYN